MSKNVKNVELVFSEIIVRGMNFVFGFNEVGGDVKYECGYKADLKGIAWEKWIIRGKIVKLGIGKGCKYVGWSVEIEDKILAERLRMLRGIRGDESKVEKFEFELVELKNKILDYEKKIEVVRMKIADKEKELIDERETGKGEKVNVNDLLKKSKEEMIKKLKEDLEKLEGGK